VAVVVPCRNEAAHISALLHALAGQTRAPDEIIIVDDRSSDGSGDVVRAWSAKHPAVPVRVLNGPGRGPGPAMNAGIRATTADVIMRMDGHAIPAPDYLERSILQCGACPPEPWRRRVPSLEPAIVGGVWDVRPGADTAMARAIAAVVSHPLGSGGAQYRQAHAQGPVRRSVDTVPFGTFPRVVWERLEGFDETLEANQDFDFNYRARKAGFEVILDSTIRATYFARPTVGSLWRQYFRYGFWKVQMLRKDPRGIRWRQLPPALLPMWLAVSVGAAVTAPGPLTLGAAALYPVVLLGGAGVVAVGRSVNPLTTFVAAGCVHLAWGLGFWAGLLRLHRRNGA
jgi:glycosyltransferase involved in cell wall biosynthesis